MWTGIREENSEDRGLDQESNEEAARRISYQRSNWEVASSRNR